MKAVELTGDLAAGAPIKAVKVLGEFGMTQEQVLQAPVPSAAMGDAAALFPGTSLLADEDLLDAAAPAPSSSLKRSIGQRVDSKLQLVQQKLKEAAAAKQKLKAEAGPALERTLKEVVPAVEQRAQEAAPAVQRAAPVRRLRSCAAAAVVAVAAMMTRPTRIGASHAGTTRR